ncbi:MAG: hypothetical protein BMS9Abin17_0895 [Acidimicrobiia bacterium]|nr:MAG: hypothetical protein BMS9Abin17_0895 [Acidimicrobiia bacterium]
MTKKLTGLEPRGFHWVIKDRLAVSERIGGYGFQHRRVRREEEIIWLQDHGINSVLSLLSSNQNSTAYESAGMAFSSCPVEPDLEPEDAIGTFEAIERSLEPDDAVVLVHRDTIDDMLAGLLAGYLIHAGMLDDPILATDVIQRILGRAIGPEGRRLIPAT